MREFLKSLGLDPKVVNSIMAEHGKQITAYRQKVTDLQAKQKDYESKISELNTKVEDNSKTLENLQSLTNENKDLKAELQMGGSKVKSEFSKFVKNEVMSRVNDDTDFVTALEDYKKENPQYFGDTVVKKVQTSPSLNTGENAPHTTNEIMNDILRGALNN